MFTYPKSISEYVYKSAFDKRCLHDLNNKGIGAFAFYEINQRAGFYDRNQTAFLAANAKASHSKRGYAMSADYLNRAEIVGFAFVAAGGIIEKMPMSCKRIRQDRLTKDGLFADFVKKGLPVDPQKFCDPVEHYRTAVWG